MAAQAHALGHEVTTVSRRATPTTAAVPHRRADLVTGAVIDATNSVRGAKALLVTGTQRLLEAAGRARARHVVAISIVGIDEAPIAYYRAKVAQERVVAASPVPWSLVRATQFHDLVAKFASGTAGFAFVPRGVPLQPVAVDEVAAHLVAVATRAPARRLPDFVGPEVRPFAEFAATWRSAMHARRLLLPLPLFGRVGSWLRAGGLCNPTATGGRVTFGEWLRGQGRAGGA
jgi:uncharacterized protein YbjT (DUF2867 family)